MAEETFKVTIIKKHGEPEVKTGLTGAEAMLLEHESYKDSKVENVTVEQE